MRNVFIFTLICFGCLSAQQNNVTTVRDGFIGIVTDGRAAGQGDVGVGTSTDAFSQFWNPAKHVFSDKACEIGITQVLGNNQEFNELNQLNLSFYNKLDTRSAYGLGFRGYAYEISKFVAFRNRTIQAALELSIDGSYSLRLSDTFAMSVGGRFILLEDKVLLLDEFSDVSSLYGIDVSGFYYGNEIAYKKFNGRWRAGFHFSNLRGRSLNDNKPIEIYAPSTLSIGTGFDFIFNQEKILGITTEYKTLLDSYVENTNGENLGFGLEGSVIALGLEFAYKEKLIARSGYSHGINRLTDSFVSIGTGFKGKYVDLDVASLLGLSEEENPIREKLRVSLSLNLEEIL
ncbi:PorV/PorQ family protein [Aquimarina algiphila]|uniref:PorV/PorQ family protein n=1 Tax=Aquimarina algiphila TaxID=2047982 RepID=A0A554VKY9_9FLAO|nr:PorV/PorQ family protein [Aquimarina algiphila]TSE08751.1 PorV/PorQ family protein [Aquimarina algiphila]